MSLRQAVNKHCRNCTYDGMAKGSWRQQVTLCSVKNCALWRHRPKTTRPIPESVLTWYGVKKGEYEALERDLVGCSELAESVG